MVIVRIPSAPRRISFNASNIFRSRVMLTDECHRKTHSKWYLEVKSDIVCTRLASMYANSLSLPSSSTLPSLLTSYWQPSHGQMDEQRGAHCAVCASKQYGKRLFNAHISFYFTFELNVPSHRKNTRNPQPSGKTDEETEKII